ncbi:MAG: thioredoxin domain-containing protein [Candidatus Latescibacteria bacterium]|nr:thioredoxin domain-containing protein [Candidatus Latescibacterota bacterium]
MRQPLPDAAAIAALPPDGGPEFNRLIFASSPYLRQHARNPVDWRPWGEEALAAARAADRPLFLSVGYSTCHWCHVMEHESFEDAEVAALLNAGFVCVKVDREERPDLDAVYMTATQLFTGRGGWPNSLWLTPDGRPWFAGTYFPREDRGPRQPGFLTLLAWLRQLWDERRDEVEKQADAIVAAVAQATALPAGAEAPPALSRALVDDALVALARDVDHAHGGFSGAPKFPPHQALALLLDEHARSGRADLLALVVDTLDGMARGGIHDHVGGGFHRYSTDARWFLPHFEKMLYDNAQLLPVYARASRAPGA